MVTSRKKTPRNKKSQEKCKRGKKKEKKEQQKGLSEMIQHQWTKLLFLSLQQQKVAQEALLQGLGMLHSKSSLEE